MAQIAPTARFGVARQRGSTIRRASRAGSRTFRWYRTMQRSPGRTRRSCATVRTRRMWCSIRRAAASWRGRSRGHRRRARGTVDGDAVLRSLGRRARAAQRAPGAEHPCAHSQQFARIRPELWAQSGYSKFRVPLLEAGVELYEVRAQLERTRGSGQTRTVSRYGNYALHAKLYVIDRRACISGR